MANVRVTSNEIALVKQKNQRVYIKLQLLNRDWNSVGVIKGRLISGNVNIDNSSDIRRTSSVTIETEYINLSVPQADISIDLQKDISANYYIKLFAGIEDNNTSKVYWYNQGVFIINKHSFTFDPKTRTLALDLVDLMSDLNGDHAGTLHAYDTIVKNSERIDVVMKQVLGLVGITLYNIQPITVLRPTETPLDTKAKESDFLVPYDLKFEVGCSAYDILNKLVNLYPYYEMGFDADGVFFCRKQLLEYDDSWVVIDAATIADLVLSENTDIDWSQVKNIVEVWGKDGLYYGEARDENPNSPFYVSSTQELRLVSTSNDYGVDTNSITDRYVDTQKAEELLKEQASLEAEIGNLSALKEPTAEQTKRLNEAKKELLTNKQSQKNNVDVSGNELAKQWAEYLLYNHCRIQDNITLQTVLMPFLNDVDFKISYRSKSDNKVKTYVVKSVSHDFSSLTTTLNCVRFYNDMNSNLWDKLSVPTIQSYNVIGMFISMSISAVTNAEYYKLYVDGNPAGTYTGTTITYEMPAINAGEHTLYVVACADYYRPSDASNIITADFEPLTDSRLITDDNDYIITDNGDNLILDEEEEE